MTLSLVPSTPDDLTLEWLDELYRDVPDGWLNLFSVERIGARTGEHNVDWRLLSDRELLAAIAQDRTETCCVWFGVATRHANTGSRRGGKTECATLPALWVDVDVAGPNHADNTGLPPNLEEAWRLVRAFPLHATAIVNTGGGLQAWWFLQEPIPVDDHALRLLDRWGLTWHRYAAERGLHIDSVFNADRIMRLPGTLNRKNTPTPVTIAEARYDARWGLDELDDYLDELPPPTANEPRPDYIGPPRPGDAYNVAHRGSDVLAKLGFTRIQRWDAQGNETWVRPGKDPKDGGSATVYADDGHTTIWSDTCKTLWPHLELRRPYDPFGLLVATTYSGDFQKATAELRAQGYGDPPVPQVLDLMAPNTNSETEGEVEVETQHGWELIDLTDILGDDYEPPKPTVLARTDGTRLLYAGRVNGIFGESGSGKSWVALCAAAHEITAGNHVLYVDLEDHVASITHRLRLLGVDCHAISDRFHYSQPQLGYSTAASTYIETIVTDHDITLAIVDSVGEAMALQSMKQNDDDEVVRWFRVLPRRLATLGPAVVVIDHVPKAQDAPKGFAIGSQRKRAAIDGHSIRAEQVKALGRDRAGVVKLSTAKDRNGVFPSGFACAELHIDATATPLRWQLPAAVAPVDEDGGFRPTVYMERVSRALELNPGLSGRQIEEVVSGYAKHVRAAVKCLIAEGFVNVVPKGAGMAHEVVRPFRDPASDPETLTVNGGQK